MVHTAEATNRAAGIAVEDLSCMTLPWEAPERTIIIEYADGRWRVVTRGRPVQLFRRRDDAWAFARDIAALYIPVWSIIEHEPPQVESVAC